jgi:hypothetical protein
MLHPGARPHSQGRQNPVERPKIHFPPFIFTTVSIQIGDPASLIPDRIPIAIYLSAQLAEMMRSE